MIFKYCVVLKELPISKKVIEWGWSILHKNMSGQFFTTPCLNKQLAKFSSKFGRCRSRNSNFEFWY